MVKFKIKEQEYFIPDFISIENYVKIYKVKDLFTEEYFAAKLINLITDCPLEDLLKSDYEQINFLASSIMNLIPLEKDIIFIDRFEIDGIHYGFFPKWQDLTFAEFMDMDTISTKSSDELLNMLHILAAIMYRPITKEITYHNFEIEEYDVKKMIPRSELFKKKLNMEVILGAQRFFFQLGRRYFLYSQASSIQKMSFWTKMKTIFKVRVWIMKSLFKKRTDGTSSSTELLEMILQNTISSSKKI